MMNIYARTFMIATMTDATEPLGAETGRRSPGLMTRARRWLAARSEPDTRT